MESSPLVFKGNNTNFMNILFHHRTQAQGAEGVHINGMVNAFITLGHTLRIICPQDLKIFRGRKHQREKTLEKNNMAEKGSFSYGALKIRQWAFSLLEICYNFYAYIVLASSVRAAKPDMIYDRYALMCIAPALIAKRHRIVLCLEVNTATMIERVRPTIFPRLARLLERIALNQATVILTVSTYLKQCLITTYGLSPSKVHVIPNAVDPHRFKQPEASGFREALGLNSKIVIGVAGAFVPWHGLDFLVLSLQDILKEQQSIQIFLVGDGPVRPQIEALAASLGLGTRLCFTGFVPAEEVPKYIACMDICVMPDSNVHGSPMKIFEYLAMGKPVVAPAYGPIQEIIQDEVTGLLFPPRNQDKFSYAIRRLLNDRNLRYRLGSAGRTHVLTSHTWTANARRVLTLLSS
jgi:glycosyltransferase involved in cell wall biosynthesis